jgi:hypothetical protein
MKVELWFLQSPNFSKLWRGTPSLFLLGIIIVTLTAIAAAAVLEE